MLKTPRPFDEGISREGIVGLLSKFLSAKIRLQFPRGRTGDYYTLNSKSINVRRVWSIQDGNFLGRPTGLPDEVTRPWRGGITLGRHGKIGLSFSGGRQSPDSESLALARELTTQHDALLPQIQASPFEHYEP
jgi:hypothetical protein